MRYRSSDIILDTSIGNNNNNVQIDCRFLKDVIKWLEVSFHCFRIMTIYWMKGEMIKEIIY